MCWLFQISFTGADEYLTQIKGTHAQVSGIEIITSISFISNKMTYGPFGRETGTAFQSPTGKRIVGLFGRAATYVDKIGVVVTEAPKHTVHEVGVDVSAVEATQHAELLSTEVQFSSSFERVDKW